MAEKKCTNCENMDICAMYERLLDIAGLLNRHLDNDIAGDVPFTYMANHMAHDCKRFKAIT